MDDKTTSFPDIYSSDIRQFKYRGIALNGDGKQMDRLAVFFSMLRLCKHVEEFKKRNESRKSKLANEGVWNVPDVLDYCFMLFPCPTTPLILPIHNSRTLDTYNTYLNKIGISISNLLKGNCLLSRGELSILENFMVSINLKTKPQWMN